MPIRFDRNELKKPQRHDSGFVRVDAYISRVGVQEYRLGDGTVRRELRPPEEVFDAASLESFAGVPVTNMHPPKLLTAADAKKYSVGAVGETVAQEQTKVRAPLAIHHADAIADVLSGKKKEVSCGYSCDLDETPGIWNGERYDAVQRNIRGNHVALVTRGRAGPEVSIRLDAQDGEAVSTPPEEKPMRKIRLDGVEYEGSEQLEQALTNHLAKRDQASVELTAKVEKLTAKFDAQTEELTKAQAVVKALQDPKAISAAVASRVQLEGSARKLLGDTAKFDGLTDKEVKLQVLTKVRPTTKFDDKADAYVDGAFEMALEAKAAGNTVAGVRAAAAAVHLDVSDIDGNVPAWLKGSDPKAARAKMLERLDTIGVAAEAK